MQVPNDTLLSFTETSDAISTEFKGGPKRSHFQIRRVFVLILISLFQLLVFFQRACPTVVTDDLSKAYNVSVSELGVFTSTFYYPYSFLQPVAGFLADVIEPSYILFTSAVLSAVGDVMMACCKTFFGGSVGRLLVGFSCSFVPSSAIRMILNWFPLEHYSKVLGVFLFIGGVGGLLAQTPLAVLSEIIGWRWCFLSISILTAFLGLI